MIPDRAGPSGVLPTTRSGWHLVFAVLGVALVLRVAVVLATRHYAPLTDAGDFDRIASSLASGHGYGNAVVPPAHGPSAFRAPGYSFVLAFVYLVFGGHSWTAGRIENVFIGTVLVALIGVIAAQLWSRRIAIVAMGLAAVYPVFLVIGSGLELEPLLVSLMLGALAAGLQARRQPALRRWPILAGVLTGLAILTRETGFLVLPAVIWLVWQSRRENSEPMRRRVLASLTVVAVALVIVAPWTIRNAVTLHAFVPVSTSDGVGLAGTYNNTSLHDRAIWITPWSDPTDGRVLLALHNPSEVKVDDVLVKSSLDMIEKHLNYPLTVAFWNTYRLFDLDGGHYDLQNARYIPFSSKLLKAAIASSYVVWLLAIVGLCFREARRVPIAVWTIPVLLYLFIVFLLPAQIRYRSTIEPYFVLLASLPISWAIDRVLARWSVRRSLPSRAPARILPDPDLDRDSDSDLDLDTARN